MGSRLWLCVCVVCVRVTVVDCGDTAAAVAWSECGVCCACVCVRVTVVDCGDTAAAVAWSECGVCCVCGVCKGDGSRLW